jgi:antitoxin ParD1/3/4
MEPKQPTETMNVALPESMKDFVHEQVASGGYTSASEYVRELIREAQRRKGAEEDLEALLLEGLNSGPATEMTDDDWQELRRRSAQRWATNTPRDK